jgi:hypothetical protein
MLSHDLAGAWRSCGFGTRWWRTSEDLVCCGNSHPPGQLKPDQVRWAPAPEVTGALQ